MAILMSRVDLPTSPSFGVFPFTRSLPTLFLSPIACDIIHITPLPKDGRDTIINILVTTLSTLHFHNAFNFLIAEFL